MHPDFPIHERSDVRALVSKSISSLLKNERTNASLSLEETALYLEISIDELRDYEGGERMMPLDQIFTLTNFLNIPPEKVFAIFCDPTPVLRSK